MALFCDKWWSFSWWYFKEMMAFLGHQFLWGFEDNFIQISILNFFDHPRRQSLSSQATSVQFLKLICHPTTPTRALSRANFQTNKKTERKLWKVTHLISTSSPHHLHQKYNTKGIPQQRSNKQKKEKPFRENYLMFILFLFLYFFHRIFYGFECEEKKMKFN